MKAAKQYCIKGTAIVVPQRQNSIVRNKAVLSYKYVKWQVWAMYIAGMWVDYEIHLVTESDVDCW